MLHLDILYKGPGLPYCLVKSSLECLAAGINDRCIFKANYGHSDRSYWQNSADIRCVPLSQMLTNVVK